PVELIEAEQGGVVWIVGVLGDEIRLAEPCEFSRDVGARRLFFGWRVGHVVSSGSGPVPRAENIAGELCATTTLPSPPTATTPPVEPYRASSCAKVSRTAVVRSAPA